MKKLIMLLILGMSSFSLQAEGSGKAQNQKSPKVSFESELINPSNEAIIKEFQQLAGLRKKINARQISLDCESDDDCGLLDYGHRLCGGPVGTLVYAKGDSQASELQQEITQLNKMDKEFQEKWMSDSLGTCVFQGRIEKVKCIDNRCL